MADLDTQILPLLPLTTGVVLPGMVVTLTLESDEARTAVAAAGAADGTLLLVPKVDDRYSRIGTVAKVEDVGRLPSGMEALVIRGVRRAAVGIGVPGTGDATWVQVEAVDEPDPSPRAKELSRQYRAVLEGIVESRGVPQVAEFLRGISDPGTIADTSGYSPDISFERKVEVLETIDVEERLEKVLGWAKEVLADISLKDKIRTDVSRWRRSERSSARTGTRTSSRSIGARPTRRRCPRTSGPRSSASSAASSERRSNRRSTAGSGRISIG
jgi:ATP-dependent Lon protease